MAKKQKEMEGEVYYPSEQVVAQANAKDWDAMAEKALKDPVAFWEAEAEELEWYKKWDKVLDDSNKPFFKWFVGAKTNIIHNAIDRHLKTHRKNKLAMIWESVVFPSPGGPCSNTWSRASSRCLAASIKILRFSTICGWPLNSLNSLGRSTFSISCSAGV